MKKIIRYAGALLLAAGFVACSEWTVPERETFENQENLEKYIPLLEAESEADLTPSMRDYFAKLREYRQTPHVKGFGWFGNWTGRCPIAWTSYPCGVRVETFRKNRKKT